ncbi:winged helix DNA-binding domain-containing protein [Nocardioides sp. JQ2195]|uniref:winged helix DNA-binding domain-containing protein n=1 Tax=Nocardioides sp. JQ2195 TaxID=2592334 RepID=UPI00143E40E8|nr:winged helix DNA-binding domain-containing protein [Nocardioides sp. JQ2195]QIX27357.1 winged helix DNA-binding domain-containing protein [Nocardioides sp. JQ2195]
MQLSARDLNRTLLARQHLLERSHHSVPAMVEHLIGLQAQENLSPYLGLAARIRDFDPRAVSTGLEERGLVRLLTMRGTIHLLVPGDALSLRQWTQPRQDKERAASQSIGEARHLEPAVFASAVSELLAHGPLSGKLLGVALEERFPGLSPTALTNLARVNLPLAQLPPRGCWKQGGGVVYQYVDRWLERPLQAPQTETIVRRWLRAHGPGTSADVTAWSGVTGLGPVMKAMDDLVRHTDESGRTLYDVADAPFVSGDRPAPVRLLGTYDNVWLSHAGRDRVTTPENRQRWMGLNGGNARTVFVDGWLEGLWRIVDGAIELELFRALTRREEQELDDEVERARSLLAS